MSSSNAASAAGEGGLATAFDQLAARSSDLRARDLQRRAQARSIAPLVGGLLGEGDTPASHGVTFRRGPGGSVLVAMKGTSGWRQLDDAIAGPGGVSVLSAADSLMVAAYNAAAQEVSRCDAALAAELAAAGAIPDAIDRELERHLGRRPVSAGETVSGRPAGKTATREPDLWLPLELDDDLPLWRAALQRRMEGLESCQALRDARAASVVEGAFTRAAVLAGFWPRDLPIRIGDGDGARVYRASMTFDNYRFAGHRSVSGRALPIARVTIVDRGNPVAPAPAEVHPRRPRKTTGSLVAAQSTFRWSRQFLLDLPEIVSSLDEAMGPGIDPTPLTIASVDEQIAAALAGKPLPEVGPLRDQRHRPRPAIPTPAIEEARADRGPVLSAPLGIDFSGEFVDVIKAGAPLPATGSIVVDVIQSRQVSMAIPIHQQQGPRTDAGAHLGTFRADLRFPPSDRPLFEVSLSVDVDGRLSVGVQNLDEKRDMRLTGPRDVRVDVTAPAPAAAEHVAGAMSVQERRALLADAAHLDTEITAYLGRIEDLKHSDWREGGRRQRATDRTEALEQWQALQDSLSRDSAQLAELLEICERAAETGQPDVEAEACALLAKVAGRARTVSLEHATLTASCLGASVTPPAGVVPERGLT